MFERILVPVDGSELSERAIPYAVALARAVKCPVHLFQGTTMPTTFALQPPISAATWQLIIDGNREAAEANLGRLKLPFLAAGVPVTAGVELGYPPLQIIEQVAGPVKTLIVMATHGRGGLARWVLGSVAEKVVRDAGAPVFVVPAFSKMAPPLKTLLVPLDGSPLAATVLPVVTELAAALDAELVLFRAVPLESPPAFAAEKAAFAYLEAERAALAKRALHVQAIVRHGDAAETIIEHACSHGVDAIAMATHGRSAIQRWALGSVADKVLHAVPAPILLLRAMEREGATNPSP
jgi:nucleotide-binding universal stress UspA family protein